MTDDQLEFHLPAPPATGDTPLVPARMVNEFVYCPRLAYLMWTQGEWSETSDTVEGKRIHGRVDRPGAPLPAPEALDTGEIPAGGRIVSRSLTLSSATAMCRSPRRLCPLCSNTRFPLPSIVTADGFAALHTA